MPHQTSGDYSRRGGKEEIRAAVLRTYLLRIRAEKGEKALASLLDTAAVPPKLLDDERSWLSEAAAARVLKAIAKVLGEGALADRGAYTTDPEALGTRVRLLRSARFVADAYLHLADNSQEETRLGTYRVAEADRLGAEAARQAATAVTVVYRRRDDEDAPEPASAPTRRATERLFCGARRGELSGFPRLWGLPSATVTHAECLAEGGETCRYEVRWTVPSERPLAALIGFPAAVVTGLAAGFAGTPLSGVVAGVLGGALGAFLGHGRVRAEAIAREKVFEDLRLKALERGLALKGELEEAPLGDLIGTLLGGKYRITRKLGSGGIGTVYAAEHANLGHEVAIKVLRGAAASDASEIARLRREAYIQTRIEHPAIAKVHDLDQMPDGSIYVVMDRLIGKPLSDRLSVETILPAQECVPYFRDVCAGLAAAHAIGAVHRDLKPGNIFLCEDGSTKILDFGMSKLGSAEALTQEGYTLGTPEYMAPEQCIGAAVSPATDLYALGVLMYETLTGELPIRAQNRRDLLELHQSRIPEPIAIRRPDLGIPAALDDAIMQCLEKNVAARPASASALGEKLAAVSFARIPPPPESRRRLDSRTDEDERGTLDAFLAPPPSKRTRGE